MIRVLMASVLASFMSLSAQAGNYAQIDWSCSEIVSFAYNNPYFSVGNETMSLNECKWGEPVLLLDKDKFGCMEVNSCRSVEPAPAYPSNPQPPHYGNDYSDPNGAWNCGSPEGCGCNRGGCENRGSGGYNDGNGGA